jgi:PAS domain-containing protein
MRRPRPVSPRRKQTVVSDQRSNCQAKKADYLDLVATLGDVTTVVDRNGRYLYWSDAAKAVFGWDPDDVVGGREDDLVHPVCANFSRSLDDIPT